MRPVVTRGSRRARDGRGRSVAVAVGSTGGPRSRGHYRECNSKFRAPRAGDAIAGQAGCVNLALSRAATDWHVPFMLAFSQAAEELPWTKSHVRADGTPPRDRLHRRDPASGLLSSEPKVVHLYDLPGPRARAPAP